MVKQLPCKEKTGSSNLSQGSTLLKVYIMTNDEINLYINDLNRAKKIVDSYTIECIIEDVIYILETKEDIDILIAKLKNNK